MKSEERVCKVCHAPSIASSFKYGITSHINASCFTCYNVRRKKILSFAEKLLWLLEDQYLQTGVETVIRGRRRRSRRLLLEDRGLRGDETFLYIYGRTK